MKYFLDTYALIEIVKGSSDYKEFINQELYTSIFNLYELYYNLLRDYGEEKAKEKFYQFYPYLLSIKNEYIFLASEWKLEHKKADVSYTDALGYIIARENNMKFLTGDKEFKSLPNVEFVK